MDELRIAMQLSTTCLRLRNDRLARELARPLRPKRLRPAPPTTLDKYEALCERLRAGQEFAR